MGKLIDIFLILFSGVVSFIFSTSQADFNKLEMWGVFLIIIPIGFAIASLGTYLATVFFFKNFYREERWTIVGILCILNLLIGALVSFNK